MPEIVTVLELKQQLKIDADNTDEDAHLVGLIEGARRGIENRIDRTIVGDPVTIKPEDVPIAKQAILMLAAHWYTNREPVAGQARAVLPFAIEWMVTPLARLGV